MGYATPFFSNGDVDSNGLSLEGESVELQQWRMVCDVDVDVGRSLGLKRR